MQQLYFEKVPTPASRRWAMFRYQLLPTIAFTCLVLFTLFFWGAYVAPIEHPQGIQAVTDQPAKEHIAQTLTSESLVRGAMGFIVE